VISLILNPDPDPDPQILLSTDPDPMLPLTSDHFLVEFVTFPTKVHKNSLNRVNLPEKYALASLNWGETETSTEILFEFKLSNCQRSVVVSLEEIILATSLDKLFEKTSYSYFLTIFTLWQV
jgi:hypothetical protein